MKHLRNCAPGAEGTSFVSEKTSRTTLFLGFCFLLFTGFLFTGCSKEAALTQENQTVAASSKSTEENVVMTYTGLAPQTVWELQQARASTARYRKLENAIKDGYVDINVILPNMGHHYLKPSLVDGTFDPKNPEILVYNEDENGDMQLVAVEYAQPINLPRPEGFSGSSDVWTYHTGFQLWLLHAWVWSYNPAGVFNATNPLVHVD